MARSRFPAIRDHVLLPWANRIAEVDLGLRNRLTTSVLTGILDQVPDAWLEAGIAADERRSDYLTYFRRRLDSASLFVEEAIRARTELF